MERRQRRRAAQQRFDDLAVDYLDLPGVSRATMFGSDGLRVDSRSSSPSWAMTDG